MCSKTNSKTVLNHSGLDSSHSTPISNSKKRTVKGASKRKSFRSRACNLKELDMYNNGKSVMKLFRKFSSMPPKELWKSPEKTNRAKSPINDFEGFETCEQGFKNKIKRLKKSSSAEPQRVVRNSV